ncbi:PDLI2 protein, partial [Polioptila caerulea]|nr:PDLI2 protein [Polioptila caerulea]
MPVTVTLPGPAPWGFRISGGRDFGKPITVSKHGKAATGDLRPGDVIVTINGESTAEMLNVEAQNKIKQSAGQLRLEEKQLPHGASLHPSGDLGLGNAPGPGPAVLRAPGVRGRVCGHPQAILGAAAAPQPGSPRDIHHFSPCQELGCLSRQNSSQGLVLPPPPCPPSAELRAPQNPWETLRERRLSSPSPNTCHSQGSEPAMRRLEEDSEVYKMLQENRELRAAPRQSSTFRLLQEALEDEEGGQDPSLQGHDGADPGWDGTLGTHRVPRLSPCPHAPRTQAVRIQDGRYRHPSCYTCADCGLSLKMRGHFWVGDELFCEKHARLRYQGPPGGPVPRPVSPRS